MKKLIDLKSPIDEGVDSIWHSFGQHWLRYAALCVTAVLTGYAGFSYTRNLLFSLALIALAEGASLYWAARVNDYGNKVQQIASVAGTLLAWISIAATDLASVTILAHGADLQVFTIFARVPAVAQGTAVYVLPALAVLQGALGTVHHFFSEESAIARDLAKAIRETHKEISLANADAKVKIAKAHAIQYRARAAAEAEGIGRRAGDKAWSDHVAPALRVFASDTKAITDDAEAAKAESGSPFSNDGNH